ncbi:OmpA family protein [Aquitalea sp. ASV15]|uniref:OmpA family protein n=1 Tax=Aquitalea sp. ASV15 TaxID=2795104 RepID=UPI0018EADAE8|nr:OmpA family protein [Aquitalea sp. ASV15]
MKTALFSPTLLVVLAVATGCSNVPNRTDLLAQTNQQYQQALSNPDIARYAPLELNQAGQALARAQTSASHHDDSNTINNLAYLAKQKLALAEEISKQKMAEAEVGNASAKMDQARLAQRTAQADQANANTRQVEANNQQLRVELSALQARQTARGMVITLGDILFLTDKADLNRNGIATAQKLADILQQNQQRNVMIEGFTDSTGSMQHNQQLSERRAMAVRSALADLGVARSRMMVRGYGESYPVAANDTVLNRQQNRRVELVLSDDGGQIPAR